MSDKQEATEQVEAGPAPLHALLAEYDNPTALVRASKKVRDAGYLRWDTFSPFPIHGIERAMGIRMTRLPWISLAGALTGLTTAILLQWWTNAYDYKWLVSGKPFWSWPANVPIWFELTILFSAFATLGGMFALNNLPLPSHPLDLKERFASRASTDKFFLLIEARDPKFDDEETKALLESTSPTVLDTVLEDRTTNAHLPRPLVYALIVLAVASFVPFAFFAQARSAKMEHGRLHVVWDMDQQPKYKAQRENPYFADTRADRGALDGTVAVGFLRADDHLYRGKVKGAYATQFPKQIAITDATMERGKVQFETYCTPCHGFAGDGDGMVHRRAEALKQGWVPPSNLHQEYLLQQPVGEIFNTITHGIRNMPAYGPQIAPEDRWAIVMYVRALQRSQASAVKDISEADRAGLK